MISERFEVDSIGRFYKADNGDSYVGVTTVLDSLVHQRLKNWFRNHGVNELKKEVQGLAHLLAGGKIDAAVKEAERILAAENAAEVKSREARKKGSRIHSLYETAVSGEGPGTPVNEEEAAYLTKFFDFLTRHNVIPMRTEEVTVSEKYGYAGTLDLLAEFTSCKDEECCKYPVKGLTVLDYKTGKYKSTMPLQLAAYAHAIEERGDYPMPELMILIVNQEGDITPITSLHKYNNFEAFLNTMEAWKQLYWRELGQAGWKYREQNSVREYLGVKEL